MIYNILFAVVGIGLIAFGLSLAKLGNRVDSWVREMSNHSKRINDLYKCNRDVNKRLNGAFKRIQALEDRLEGIDALVATLEEKLNNSGGEE